MERGYIALTTVLIVMSVVLTTVSTVALLAIGEGQSGFSLFKGEETLTFVEGCAEDALLKARASGTFGDPVGTPVTVTRPEGSCIITVLSKVGNPTVTWTMRVQADTATTKYNRIIEVVFNKSATGITLSTWKEIASAPDPTSTPTPTPTPVPSPFTCTQVIGYSQVGNQIPPNPNWGWYWAGGVFEPIVGDSKWQLIWRSGGGVDLWKDPAYVGWTSPLQSACTSNSTTPERVLLSVSGPNGSNEALWVSDITATINTIRSKLPSVQQIILQSVVGGPGHATCPLGCDELSGTCVRASWQHKYIDNAIATVVTAETGVIGGFSPEVTTCADYVDSLGHLTLEGASAVAQSIGNYYAP